MMSTLRFKLVDYGAILLLGAATAIVSSLVLKTGMGMFAAMWGGMAIGMVLFFLFLPVMSIFSSSFHFMPPGMVVAMTGGMGAGMAVAMGVPAARVLSATLLFSATVQLAIDLLNLKLKGEVPLGR